MAQRPPLEETIAADEAERGPRPGKPGAELAMREALRQRLDVMAPQFALALPRRIGITSAQFTRQALTGMQASKQARALSDLMRYDAGRASMFLALMECARNGLMPFTEEATIVPFGKKERARATFIPMYKGLRKQMLNSGQVAGVDMRLIYRADDWSEAYGTGGGFTHKPNRFDGDGQLIPRGRLDIQGDLIEGEGDDNPPILAYCYVALVNGGWMVTVTDLAEAKYIRDNYSRAYQAAETSWDEKPPKRDSPWHTNFEAMWMKCPVRRSPAPRSPELIEMMAADRDEIDSAPPGEPATEWEEALDPASVLDGDGIVEADWFEGEDDPGAGEAASPSSVPPGPREPTEAERQWAGGVAQIRHELALSPEGLSARELAARTGQALTGVQQRLGKDLKGEVVNVRIGREYLWRYPDDAPISDPADPALVLIDQHFTTIGLTPEHTGQRIRAVRAILGGDPDPQTGITRSQAHQIIAKLAECIEADTEQSPALANLRTFTLAAEAHASNGGNGDPGAGENPEAPAG